MPSLPPSPPASSLISCRHHQSSSRDFLQFNGETVEETAALVDRSLIQLDEELKAIDPALRAEWNKAQIRCPQLVNRKHKLMFLRCECFDAELAALRLVNYWNKRVVFFGEDAFEPLSMERSMRNDMAALSMGNVIWTQLFDDRSRGIFVEDLSKFDAHFDRPSHSYLRERSMVRVWWYLIHAALEDERVQRNGVVHVILARPFGLWRNFTFKQAHVLMDLMAFALPIRFVESHLCRPGLLLRCLALSIFRRMLAKRQRLEIPTIIHLGSPEKVSLRLMYNHQIPKEAIPRGLGGDLAWDQGAWIRQRREAGL